MVAAGRAAMLGGSVTKPALASSNLDFAWRVIEAPEGADVEILDAASRQARFIARTPGRYHVRLDVVERSAGAAPATGASAAPADDMLGSDEVEIAVTPTDDPMGVPVETITANYGVRIGDKTYQRTSVWLRILVLDETTLTQLSNTAYGETDLARAKAQINALSGDEIVIMVAWLPKQFDYPTRWYPKRCDSLFDRKGFLELIASVGGVAETPDGWATMANSQFSLIGRKGLGAGLAWQNSGDPPTLYLPQLPGQAGSLNSYFQMVDGNAYSFVTPQALAIDTEAQGSDGYTHNTIKLGDRSFNSALIDNGMTAAQLVVLDFGLALVANATFIIYNSGAVDGDAGDPARGAYGHGVKGLAAALEHFNRNYPGNTLIILQSFGQGQLWGNTPAGSPSWVNDDVQSINFPSWDGRVFVAQDGADNPANALYRVWNPGYSTVAGQVGVLTSGAGHDIVAAFGYEQYNAGTPNGGLTVVGSSHQYDGRRNFVQGQTFNVTSRPRLVGTLVRTRQWQWTVETGSATDVFDVSRLWQMAFGASKPWPFADGAGHVVAMAQVASALWGQADVRPQYVLRKSADWDGLAATVAGMRYAPSGAYTEAEFNELRDQLTKEMRYVAAIKNIVTQWQNIFRDNSFSGYVDLQAIARAVIADAMANAGRHAQETAGLDWLGIIGYSLAVAESILAFTPVGEFTAPLGIVANVLGLASILTTDHGEAARAGRIRARSGTASISSVGQALQPDGQHARPYRRSLRQQLGQARAGG